MSTPTLTDLPSRAAIMNGEVRSQIPWSRDDTIIHLTEEPLKGSETTPAWFFTTKADIYLNVAQILDGTVPVAYDDIRPLFWGFTAHEAAHSLWSNWETNEVATNRAEADVATCFEELRVEKRAVDMGAVEQIRKSYGWLLAHMAASEVPTDEASIARLWALVYGRHLAGIATADEVKAVDEIARVALGDTTVEILREILSEAIEVEIPDRKGPVRDEALLYLQSLVREWLDLLPPPPEEETTTIFVVCVSGDHAPGEEDGETEGAGAAGGEEDDPEHGEGTPGLGTISSVKSKKDLSEDIEGVYVEVDAETSELLRQAMRDAAKEMDHELPTPETPLDIANPAEWAKVFKRHGSGHAWGERQPTANERMRARSLARTLENLSLPTITKTKNPSVVPPGRLRGREMVRAAADRSRGGMTNATPWEHTRRRHSLSKPVIVGAMTDVSGSMSWAQELMGSFAWVIATAGVHIGARTAAVTFGDNVEAVTHPGEVPQMVRTRAADGGTEEFDKAAAAIESVLHLSAPTNYAKVLFIMSDAHLVIDDEPLRAREWIRRWTAGGTIVVWVAGYGEVGRMKREAERKPGVLRGLDVNGSTRDLLWPNLEKEIVAAARTVV